MWFCTEFPSYWITCLTVCDCLAFPGKITLRDLKRCKLSHIFFDTFFNIEKYLEHEQKDPFSVIRVRDANPRCHFPGSAQVAHLTPSFVSFRSWRQTVKRCPTGRNTPLKNTTFWWLRRLPTKNVMMCKSLSVVRCSNNLYPANADRKVPLL